MTRPKVLAYYFPSWHEDGRNAEWFGSGWTEWELLERAKPRFGGHRQPRVPAAGRIDEADPAAMAAQIELAAGHGVDGFLFDFYWYDDGPYLNRALDEGFLGAPNCSDVEFALMWANHDLTNIFPSRTPHASRDVLKHGGLDRAAFERMAEHILTTYFTRPNYLRVNNKPWLSIYETGSLIEGLGGVNETADALRWFGRRARKLGFDGIHFDAVVWGFEILPAATEVREPADLIERIGFESATSYVWIHHVDLAAFPFPTSPWRTVEDGAFDAYATYAQTLPVPFHPNVTVGWDASPRTAQDQPFVAGSYPWTPVWDPSPAEFERGLERAREFARAHPSPHPIVTLNAWNEWTEGSVLLPDTVNGTELLDAVLRVFGPREEH